MNLALFIKKIGSGWGYRGLEYLLFAKNFEIVFDLAYKILTHISC
jgi:hypothetical protein